MPVPKWLQKLSNATIKASIAENPAVATASGWTINNGEAQQNATEDPGVQKLRENLPVIATIPLSEMGTSLFVEGALPYIARKAKDVKNLIRSRKTLLKMRRVDNLSDDPFETIFYGGRRGDTDIRGLGYFKNDDVVVKTASKGNTAKIRYSDQPFPEKFKYTNAEDARRAVSEAWNNSNTPRSTQDIVKQIASDSERVKSGDKVSLIMDEDLSKDSYPLLQSVLKRNQLNGRGTVGVIKDDNTYRMIHLNHYGNNPKSLKRVDAAIRSLRDLTGDQNIPGRVSVLGEHFVPAFEFTALKQGGVLKAQEGNIIWDSGKYLIPVVGTYYSIKDAVNDPSWKNIGLAGLSALGDAASIFGVGELAKAGVGAIKAGKTLKAMKPAMQAVEETSKIASKAANTYNKARQATNAVSLMNDLDSPMSTVVKMAKKENAARAAFQAATKNADDAYNYWDGLQMLYNKQRAPINRDAITAGVAGFVGTNAAQQAIKEKRGGVLKAQSGTKSLYQLIMQENPSTYTDGYGVEREEYEPKWIKVVRNIRQRLSPTLNNNGERKYVGSSGMLGFLVAPEWEGLEMPEITSMHIGFQGTPRGISAVETSRFVNVPKQVAEVPKSVVKGNSTAAPKKPSKAMLQAFKERTGFDFSVAPKEMQEREIAAWEKHVADIRARYRKNR